MSIPTYVPGKPVDEVARELGLEAISKLASNECPTDPFPPVVEAIVEAARAVNRYPDTGSYVLRHALGEHHRIDPESIWVGSGSSDILRSLALSVGGPGTSAVFPDPSFIMYPINTQISASEAIRVPLTADYRHDLAAMIEAVRPDTTVVYMCTPNNPTGGHIPGDALRNAIAQIPRSVVVVVDEAYAEYVTAPDYQSMLSEAASHPNVAVLRTFSKVYGLAGLRIGYGVANPELIAALRRTQAPFPVTNVAQAAALASLELHHDVANRVRENDEGRIFLLGELRSRGARPADSQANFVYFVPSTPAAELAEALMGEGVIVRPLGDGLRVSIGTAHDNRRFIDAYDSVMEA
jgi:histidinol-phosphate aminotransferase